MYLLIVTGSAWKLSQQPRALPSIAMRQNSPQTTKYLRALGEAEQVWAAEKDTVPDKPTEGPRPRDDSAPPPPTHPRGNIGMRCLPILVRCVTNMFC